MPPRLTSELLHINPYFIEQFSVAASVYYVTSALFPAKETYLDAAILADDAHGTTSSASDDIEKSSLEEMGDLQADVKSISGRS